MDAWKNLVKIWSNAENILYLISNRKGQKPREAIGGAKRKTNFKEYCGCNEKEKLI